MGSQLEAYLHQTSDCTRMVPHLFLMGFLNTKNSHNIHTRITLGKRKVVCKVKLSETCSPSYRLPFCSSRRLSQSRAVITCWTSGIGVSGFLVGMEKSNT